MTDIKHCQQNYLGVDYPRDRTVVSGGVLLRQHRAQRHTMDGDTVTDTFGLLEPVSEDWHSHVCLLSVSEVNSMHT